MEPNGKVVEKSFATGFLNGLAMPGAQFYAERCEHGLAKMETKLTIPNMLASGITFGLYTPMSVKAYCAEGDNASAFHRMKPRQLETFSEQTEPSQRETTMR
jgi:hypothetical protein